MKEFLGKRLEKVAKAGVVLGMGASALLLTGCTSNTATEEVPSSYICLQDEARGRDRPSVQNAGGEGPSDIRHYLHLQSAAAVCYKTEDGTTIKAEDLANPANGQWVRVDFAEVHQSIEDGTVINAETRQSAEDIDIQRLGEFASNWPIDFISQKYTWVNTAKADVIS